MYGHKGGVAERGVSVYDDIQRAKFILCNVTNLTGCTIHIESDVKYP